MGVQGDRELITRAELARRTGLHHRQVEWLCRCGIVSLWVPCPGCGEPVCTREDACACGAPVRGQAKDRSALADARIGQEEIAAAREATQARLAARGLTVRDGVTWGAYRLRPDEREQVLRALLLMAGELRSKADIQRREKLAQHLAALRLPHRSDPSAWSELIPGLVKVALPPRTGADGRAAVERALLAAGFPSRPWREHEEITIRETFLKALGAPQGDSSARSSAIAEALTRIGLAGRLLRFVDELETLGLPAYFQRWAPYAEPGFKEALAEGAKDVAEQATKLAQCLRAIPMNLYRPLDAFLCERVALDGVQGARALEDLSRLAEHLGTVRAGRLEGVSLLLELLAEASRMASQELHQLIRHHRTPQLGLAFIVATAWKVHLCSHLANGAPEAAIAPTGALPAPSGRGTEPVDVALASVLETLTEAVSHTLGLERIEPPGGRVQRTVISRVCGAAGASRNQTGATVDSATVRHRR